MKHMRRMRPSPSTAIAIAALVVAASGVAVAAIPGEGGVIDGCYDHEGNLRVIDADAGESCRPSEQALSWNQVGPEGPAGPPGEQGDPGPPGPSGGATVVARRTLLSIPPGQFTHVTASCAAGERATGGGGVLSGVFDTPNIVRSYPSRLDSTGAVLTGEVARSWTVLFQNPRDVALNAFAFVVCIEE